MMKKKQIRYRYWVILFTLLLQISALNSKISNDDKLVVDLSGHSWGMEGAIPGEGVKLNFHNMEPDHVFE